MKYQIKDWAEHFENNRSRQVEKCSFVCVPNKQSGLGFCRIISEPEGAAIYGIWQMILGACSQQKTRDGWLTSDGHHDGTPWSLQDLALKFRRPEKEIAMAIEVLTSESVGWIVTHDCRPSDAQVTPDCRLGALKEGRKELKEGNGTEGNGTASGGKYHKDARSVLHFLNETAGKHFRETDENLKSISARLRESEVDFEGCKTMIVRQSKKWKGTEYQDYLQPSTLFRASKFDGYYAARDQPVIPPGQKPASESKEIKERISIKTIQ